MDVIECEGARYLVTLIGDFNARIGGWGGSGDHVVNVNGRRLLRLVKEMRLSTVNRLPACEGKWTWWAGEKQSIIDGGHMQRK